MVVSACVIEGSVTTPFIEKVEQKRVLARGKQKVPMFGPLIEVQGHVLFGEGVSVDRQA